MAMSKQYTCELCNKVFNQKIDFTRHQNKKAPCITINKMQELTQTKEVKTDFKTNLSTIFNYCLDVLRNNEHLTGDKALRTLAHLLDLRLLEPQFDNQIDINNYNYDFSSYEDHIIEKHKTKLLTMVRFSNLVKEKEENIPKIMKCLWDEILSVHPITKNIFLKGKGFDIQHQSTYKKLIDKLHTFNFEAVDDDILGEAYEEVIKDVMTGKVLGQFFTPPKVKQMMIKLIDPQLKADGTIEKIFDPAMGTGGFLISSLRHLLQQSKTKGIQMNWNFISNEGLGGREAEPDTYQLAISNMLISTGHMFNVLEKGDSIRNPITKKYDIILANPPFGIDGLIYNEILHPLRNEYIPIKSNSAVPLFLQAIIYMLKVNGRCAVVLPNGKELFNKGTELVAVREYLMKTCDLKEIYYLPPVFTHTTISTCVFNFIKKKECFDVLETKIKISKTQKEIAREYNFIKSHQTNKVKFYNYNPENEMKHLLIEVPIEKISKNGYSLNYAEYLNDTTETNYDDNIVVKTLEEICSIDYGTRIVRSNNIEGEYPVFGSGRQMFSTETFNREGFNVLIGRFALSLECVRIVNQKLFLNDSGLSVKPKIDNVLHKYIAYYLFENQNIIYDCARGTAQKNLDMNKFKNLKIPIPSLEQQKEIIKQIDALNNENKKLEEQIKENIKKSKQIISNIVVKPINDQVQDEPINDTETN
jgi:type I restriction enzyme M protein